MKIYTKTGDAGETGLFAGPRVRKDHPRIEAYGAVDELNAALGVARCETEDVAVGELLQRIQNDLFTVGAELATPDPAKRGSNTIGAAQVEQLEADIDRLETQLEPLREFILPGGCRSAAALHLARTICRRAERRVVSLHASEPDASSRVPIYLNRLGDLLFVVARVTNRLAATADVPWRKSPT